MPDKECVHIRGERKMKNRIVEFLKDEDGQTSTEYILLVAMVAIIVLKFKQQLQEQLNALLGNVFDNVNSELADGFNE